MVDELIQPPHPPAVEAEAEAGAKDAAVVHVLARLDRPFLHHVGKGAVEFGQLLPGDRGVEQQLDPLSTQQGAVEHPVEAGDALHCRSGAGGFRHQIHVLG